MRSVAEAFRPGVAARHYCTGRRCSCCLHRRRFANRTGFRSPAGAFHLEIRHLHVMPSHIRNRRSPQSSPPWLEPCCNQVRDHDDRESLGQREAAIVGRGDIPRRLAVQLRLRPRSTKPRHGSRPSLRSNDDGLLELLVRPRLQLHSAGRVQLLLMPLEASSHQGSQLSFPSPSLICRPPPR
ncbi:hypothetical protein MUK42_31501 [Musa troglodytarum]|uniref:Uncharacterized protein n=1 Tax=Musa troglodytarum TaxID=320322 RepID=A0A9E7FPP2_9LILI|nr:hypothetical protein MUK42_31501 [Musa troglodytarum]